MIIEAVVRVEGLDPPVSFRARDVRTGSADGARADFEQMVTHLVAATMPGVRSVKANPGDWGIDTFVLAEGQKLLASGMTVEEVCRQFAIAESTWARWLNQYGGMKADAAKRLKELESENARLKKLLAEVELATALLRGPGAELSQNRADRGTWALTRNFASRGD